MYGGGGCWYVCATTLGLSAGCARAILSLVAFVSGSLWFGGRSLRRGIGSKIGAAAAHVPGPDREFRFRGPGGIFLAARGPASGVLVGDVVHLLLIAAVPTGVWLRSPCPRAAGLWSVFGFPLRLDFALVELFGSGIFFK
jgi:hypothetical protein